MSDAMEVVTDEVEKPQVLRIPPPWPPAVLQQDSYDEFRGTETPLVIDNGSTNLRYGFCSALEPHSGTNVIARFKDRKSNKPVLVFGETVEMDSGARAQARTPWEGDVLLNFDALENALDYAFIHLGIDGESVAHPVIMTERLCTPLHSRALTSELMFEQYQTPSVAYCVDGIMSFYHNNLRIPTTPFAGEGLVISFNTASTSVIPVVRGRGVLNLCKRIPWGASQANDYLNKLIQLKYSNFPTRVNSYQCNWIFQNCCEFAPDYTELLRKLADPLQLRAFDRVIQFPFTAPVESEKTEEELIRAAERRKEQGKKLQEFAAAKRASKLFQREADLRYLTDLREGRGKDNKKDWLSKLQTEGFDNDAALDEAIKKLEGDIKRARRKDNDNAEEEEMEEPSYPLLDVPDADLDEEQLKEKRKQKLMKAGYEARARARREKEREKEERETEERKEGEERERDLTGWAERMRKEHEATVNRIKERNRRKAALQDRKSAVSQARMKSIASLAADDRVPKKRRKGNGEDMFGADDADWAIYRKINTQTVSSDEEDDLAKLDVVEQKLLTYDPTFQQEHTYASIMSKRSALLTAFRPQYEEGDIEGNTRLHLSTERYRVCETWFSPSMAGVDSAGLAEVIQNVLARLPEDDRRRVSANVMVTGAPSRLPGLLPRLQNAIRPILPPEWDLGISRAENPALDAWHGMAKFAKTGEFKSVGISRAEYEEYGGERIRKWWASNWNSATVP